MRIERPGWLRSNLRRRAVWPGLLVAAVLLPLVLSVYHLTILTQILIFGLFAMSLDLLVGYTGLVSLGHAAFFGLGAYAAGYAAIHWNPSALLTFPVGIAVAAAGALVIGFLSIRARGVYFLMITLAFAQMIHAAATKAFSITGGSNGLSGIPRPTIGLDSGLLWQGVPFYYFVLAGFAISALVLARIVASPFGRVLLGIRENEERMRAIGYDTQRLKLAAFVIAGSFAGLAGALYAAYNGIVAPSDVHWSVSGDALIMVIVGGAGTLGGPVLGAAIFLVLQNLVSSITERWQLIAGAIFIFFVLALPGGVIRLFNGTAVRPGWRGGQARLARERESQPLAVGGSHPLGVPPPAQERAE